MTATRLLLIGPFGPGHLADSYARGFARHGVDVVRFDSDRAYLEASRFASNRYYRRLFRRQLWGTLQRATVAMARTVRPHAVMAVKCAYLDAQTVRTITQELGVPFVNYYPDNPYCGVPLNPRKTSAQRRDLIDVLKAYTRVWTWEPGLTSRLQTDGVTAAYLPFGVDDDVFRSDAAGSSSCLECAGDHRVVFVGQHSDKREAHLSAIRAHAVGLWGNRWSRATKRFNGRHVVHRTPVAAEASAALYRRADVSLNVVDDLNMPGHNMRTFEITGSGGVMLASYTAEQDAIFPEGEAAAYYRTPDELDEQLSRLRSDRARAERIRHNAIAIASQHSYTRRAATILAELGLD